MTEYNRPLWKARQQYLDWDECADLGYTTRREHHSCFTGLLNSFPGHKTTIGRSHHYQGIRFSLSVMFFATRIVACSSCSSIHAYWQICGQVVPSNSSHYSTCTEGSDITLRYTDNIPQMPLLVFIVPTKTFTARFWRIPNPIWVCRSAICTTSTTTHWVLNSLWFCSYFWRFETIMRHFHWFSNNAHSLSLAMPGVYQTRYQMQYRLRKGDSHSKL